MKKLFVLALLGLLFVSFASAAWDTSLTPYLKLYVGLNETSGTTAVDYVNQFNGTYVNTPSLGEVGKYQNAIRLTAASSEMVNFTTSDGNNLIFPNGNWTLNFWVNISGASASSVMVSKINNGTPNYNGFAIQEAAFGAITTVYAYLDGTGSAVRLGNEQINTSKYIMITVRKENNNVTAFINNTQQGSTTITADINSTRSFKIGWAESFGNYFNQRIDEVMLFNKSLTNAEISNLWNSSFGNFCPTFGCAFTPTISLNSPANNSEVLVGSSVTFNWTSEIGSGAVVNTSIYLDGALNETISISGASNTTTTTKTFSLGTHIFSFRTCSSSYCTNSSNYTLLAKHAILNSLELNTTTFETAYETYIANISNTSSLTAANLVYNNTNYALTYNGTMWTYSGNIPTNIGNSTVYVNFTALGVYSNSSTIYYQNVSSLVWANCNATFAIPFLNISFKNEVNSTNIGSTVPSSTFTYYLGNGTVNKTLTFSNTSMNMNYTFCSSAVNRTINVLPYFQYSATGYPQRVWTPSVTSYTNTTTSQVLYMLPTASGIYVTFQVINSAEQPLEDVIINITQNIGGSDVVVGAGTTGASGTVTLWLNPDFVHTLTAGLSPYPTYTATQAFTDTEYTITLGAAEESTAFDYLSGITYLVKPTNYYLDNDTIYNFNFSITSTYWSLESYGFNITNENGVTYGSASGSTSGGSLVSVNINTSKNESFCMNYYWVVNSTYTNATRCWSILDLSQNGFSLANALSRLSNYVGLGLWGLDDFGVGLLCFLVIVMTTGTLRIKYGITDESTLLGIVFGLVSLLDIGFNLIPNPVNAIAHFPTILVAFIFVGFITKEAFQ